MSVDAAAEEQFGPYLVYERLGVGGMATVHRALEQGAEGFERVVALKRLLPHLAEDASFIKSFVREAKLASLLNHVNIVQIYELGRVGTEYFISMEYIDGRDLRRILRHARKVTGPPPIHIAVGLMIQLCDALDYAHNRADENGQPLGLVHRDISPSNLIVTSGGHLKIIDFGIAKAQSSQLRTQTGRVKGKLAYMAPEAVSGSRDLDARSDLWACGVILHELLTARPLFASKNEYQTLLKVQRGDIMPPSTFNQACPPELDTIVFRALARDADQRFANAAELREALVKLKVQKSLQTGNREIASWLDWAFNLDIPASFANSPDSSSVSAQHSPKPPRAKTPRPPRNTEEDEAVEVVWGGGNVESEDGPVVLDDVPDVSEKHQRPKEETGSPFDDIPTPKPAHGTLPSIYAEQIMAQTDDLDGIVIEPTRTPRATSRHTIPRRQTGVHEAVGDPTLRPHRATSQGLRASSPSLNKTGPVPALDTPQVSERIAAQRARDSSQPFDAPRARSESGANTAASDDAAFDPMVTPVAPMPVVRFSRTNPPPSGVEATPAPSTKLDVGPVRADTSPREHAVTKPPSNIQIGASIAARGTTNKTNKRLLVVLGALVLAGGTATAVAIAVGKGKTEQAKRDPAPPPARDTGTVRFVLEPPDAEIKIGGNVAHTGSPWASELAAGTHQIEIHRQGYKSWLTSIELSPNETQTLRVVLEPLGAIVADASLTIATTPPGLEVVIDGQVQAQRTPFRSTLKPGAHRIALRQNGVEVWQQQVMAEVSSELEFNPSFTAEKARERAQRAPRVTQAPAIATDKGDISPEKLAAAPSTTPAAPATVPGLPSIALPIVPSAGAPPAGDSDATAKPPAPKQTPVQPAPKQAPPKPAITSVPQTAAAAPVVRRGPPPIVPPVAVKKLSGEQPSIAKHRNMELPASLAAKLCIDEAGRVTSADIMSKVERRISSDIIAELRTWRYSPYRVNGAPSPACFVVTLRTK